MGTWHSTLFLISDWGGEPSKVSKYGAGNQMCHVIITDALIWFNFIIKAVQYTNDIKKCNIGKIPQRLKSTIFSKPIEWIKFFLEY